jgi:MFS family permease
MSAFAAICGVLCHLIIYFTQNFGLIIFGFVLYGLGIGIGYYPILKTTWKYFPKKKGFLTGFILCVFGLCPFVFTSIADAVINPKGEKMVGDYYPQHVAIKMKDFALIMAITMGVCGILSQLLMFPLDNVTNDISENVNKKKNQSYVSNEIYDKDKESNEYDKSNEDDEDLKEKNYNEPFMEAFKSLRFHLFNLMSVGTLCKFIYFYHNLFNSFWILFN